MKVQPVEGAVDGCEGGEASDAALGCGDRHHVCRFNSVHRELGRREDTAVGLRIPLIVFFVPCELWRGESHWIAEGLYCALW